MKPVEWIGRTREDLLSFPRKVVRQVGKALTVAQYGGKHQSAKALKGFGGAGVLEIIEDFDGDTYRAVYTVKFTGVIYVLHAFQKKAKRRIATPKKEVNLIRARLKDAQKHYKVHYTIRVRCEQKS